METLKKENGVVVIPSVYDVYCKDCDAVYEDLIDLLIEESTKEVQIYTPNGDFMIHIKKDNILDYKFKILLSCRHLSTQEKVGLDETMYIYPGEFDLSGITEDLYNILNYYSTEASYFYWVKFDGALKQEEEYNSDAY